MFLHGFEHWKIKLACLNNSKRDVLLDGAREAKNDQSTIEDESFRFCCTWV